MEYLVTTLPKAASLPLNTAVLNTKLCLIPQYCFVQRTRTTLTLATIVSTGDRLHRDLPTLILLTSNTQGQSSQSSNHQLNSEIHSCLSDILYNNGYS